MSRWYELQRGAAGELIVTFHHHPDKRWFPPDVLQDLRLPVKSGDRVILTGSGAMWMYFHVACCAVAKGAGRIEVQMVDGSKTHVFPLEPATQATWPTASPKPASPCSATSTGSSFWAVETGPTSSPPGDRL